MKHIKILLALTSIVLALAMLSGCVINTGKDAEKENDVEKEQASVTEVVNAEIENNVPENETVANPVVDSSNNGNAIVSKETFISVIGSLVDLSLYGDLSAGDYSGYSIYSYTLKSENKVTYNLDYKVTLGDGTTFTMPIDVADLKDMGWSLKYSSDQTIRPGYKTEAWIENADGQAIYAEIYNDGTIEKSLENCTVIGVQMNQYSTDTISPHETAPGFTVCGNITEDSGIADIINKLGTPTSIVCSIHYDDNNRVEYTKVELGYGQPDEPRSGIRFELSGTGDYIAIADYNIAP